MSIPFHAFTANEVFPVDLFGDGRLELLCLQSPGIYKSDVYNGTKYAAPPEERAIYCLTAISLDGQILWQLGKPNLSCHQHASHVADQMVCGGIGSIAKPEVAVLKSKMLLILDAASGAVKRSTDLDADNYGIVLPIRTRQGTRLLVQATDYGYSPYQYASPAVIYDSASLNRIATIPAAVGSGHSPRAVDLDGDGNDEILTGYEAYDANGAMLWRVHDLGKVSPIRNHVDQLQVGSFGSPPQVGVVYAGSFNAVMTYVPGKLAWMRGFGHPQHVILGDFRMGDKRACMAIYCCRDLLGDAQNEYLARIGTAVPEKGNRNNIAFLNAAGEIVSLIFPPALKYHSGEGILLYPQGCADGTDAVITRDWAWPEALNVAGEHLFAFVHPKETIPNGVKQPTGPGPDGYGVRIADFDQDGRADILIHDQSAAWIYRPTYPSPGDPNTHKELRPITGQTNYIVPVSR